MTIQYAIVAFPAFEAADWIESVRARFDPLTSMLAAHVTVVFPFTHAGPATELSDHTARVAAGLPPVDLTLSELSVEAGGYIMLNVAIGADRFVELHKRSYTGMLASHRSLAHAYRPHVTVGRLADPEQLASAVKVVRREFTRPIAGRVTELALFRLDGAGAGSVVATSGLGSGPMRAAPNVR